MASKRVKEKHAKAKEQTIISEMQTRIECLKRFHAHAEMFSKESIPYIERLLMS